MLMARHSGSFVPCTYYKGVGHAVLKKKEHRHVLSQWSQQVQLSQHTPRHAKSAPGDARRRGDRIQWFLSIGLTRTATQIVECIVRRTTALQTTAPNLISFTAMEARVEEEDLWKRGWRRKISGHSCLRMSLSAVSSEKSLIWRIGLHDRGRTSLGTGTLRPHRRGSG